MLRNCDANSNANYAIINKRQNWKYGRNHLLNLCKSNVQTLYSNLLDLSRFLLQLYGRFLNVALNKCIINVDIVEAMSHQTYLPTDQDNNHNQELFTLFALRQNSTKRRILLHTK